MRKALLILLLGLTGCGENKQSPEPTPRATAWEIPAEFQPLTDEFYNYYTIEVGGELPKNLVIKKVATLSAGNAQTIGICYWSQGGRGYPIIEIKANYWDTSNIDAQRALLYHELGHCMLLRGHENTTAYSPSINGQVPVSIMYPYIITSISTQVRNFYLFYFGNYLVELFDPTQIGNQVTIINTYGSKVDLSNPPDIHLRQEMSEDGACTQSHHHD